MPAEATVEGLLEPLADSFGRRLGSAVEVEAVEPLGGGASREILAVTAGIDGERRELVMRRDPPGRAGGSRSQEFDLIAAAHRHGVPSPSRCSRSIPPTGWGRGS
jgi:hypothetical protein